MLKHVLRDVCLNAAIALAWVTIMPAVLAVAFIAWLAEGLEE